MGPSDELVDIVDVDDQVIGVATRAEMRSKNLRHRCAEIAVVNTSGDIYVHRRTATKDVYPGMYDMVVGGVLATDESWDEGAARELARRLASRACRCGSSWITASMDRRNVPSCDCTR